MFVSTENVSIYTLHKQLKNVFIHFVWLSCLRNRLKTFPQAVPAIDTPPKASQLGLITPDLQLIRKAEITAFVIPSIEKWYPFHIQYLVKNFASLLTA